MKNYNQGFTLIELLVTIAIMSIVLALGVSYLSSGKYEVKSDAMILYTNLQKIKSYAIRYRATQSIVFNISSNSYTLVLTQGNTTNNITINLSDKVEYGDGGHGTTSYHTVKFGTGTVAYFYPNGSCSPSGSVYLKSKSSDDDTYRIVVTIAGNIRILKWDGASWVN
jgi:prepilin-type N-terminal cleavage/methylation domain-containing protein